MGLTASGEAKARELGVQARGLYESESMCCSEAVLWVINTAFDGGLTMAQSRGLASGLCGGIGDAGCVCGALSAAAIAQGLILGKGAHPAGEKTVRRASKRLHDAFVVRFGSACCRTLCQVRDANGKGPCLGYVAFAAELCAHGILFSGASHPEEGKDETVHDAQRHGAWIKAQRRKKRKT